MNQTNQAIAAPRFARFAFDHLIIQVILDFFRLDAPVDYDPAV